jgi:hypothetical protein
VIGLAVLAFAVVTLLLGVATTSYTAYPLSVFRRDADPPPGWIRPCRRHHPGEPPYTLRCGRVDARVLYVQRGDPDGDHDTHAIAIAGARPVIIKFRAGAKRPPSLGVGDRLRATGTLSKGRFGIAEITAAEAR